MHGILVQVIHKIHRSVLFDDEEQIERTQTFFKGIKLKYNSTFFRELFIYCHNAIL